MTIDILSFVFGAGFMAIAVMTACISIMRRQNKQKVLTAPEFITKELGPGSLRYKVGETVQTYGCDYIVRSISYDLGDVPRTMVLERKDVFESQRNRLYREN